LSVISYFLVIFTSQQIATKRSTNMNSKTLVGWASCPPIHTSFRYNVF